MSRLPRPTELAHSLVAAVVRPGDTVVDATVGNGRDTAVLARLVGPAGRVIGFDVQPRALEAARRRLAALEGAAACELHCESHAAMGERVPDRLAAAMFNLGYLPGGDHAVVTRTTETLAGLEAAWRRLATGGLLTVVCYPGHPGGEEEADAVARWTLALADTARVARYQMTGTRKPAPFLLAAEKRAG